MKTIEEKANTLHSKFTNTDKSYAHGIFAGFKNGVEFAQRWISVDEEIECSINIDGIMYSENVFLKVNGFEFPLVGCYMKANDDEFWVIYGSFEVEQSEITHYRPIELK